MTVGHNGLQQMATHTVSCYYMEELVVPQTDLEKKSVHVKSCPSSSPPACCLAQLVILGPVLWERMEENAALQFYVPKPAAGVLGLVATQHCSSEELTATYLIQGPFLG